MTKKKVSRSSRNNWSDRKGRSSRHRLDKIDGVSSGNRRTMDNGGAGWRRKKEIHKRDKRKPRARLPPPLSYLPPVPLGLLSTLSTPLCAVSTGPVLDTLPRRVSLSSLLHTCTCLTLSSFIVAVGSAFIATIGS